jgi:hypothetical protein
MFEGGILYSIGTLGAVPAAMVTLPAEEFNTTTGPCVVAPITFRVRVDIAIILTIESVDNKAYGPETTMWLKFSEVAPPPDEAVNITPTFDHVLVIELKYKSAVCPGPIEEIM